MKFRLTEIGLVPIAGAVSTILTSNDIAMAASKKGLGHILGPTFINGPGTAIFQILCISIVGWLAAYFAKGIGKGQTAELINVGTTLGCAMVIINVAWNLLVKILGFAVIEVLFSCVNLKYSFKFFDDIRPLDSFHI